MWSWHMPFPQLNRLILLNNILRLLRNHCIARCLWIQIICFPCHHKIINSFIVERIIRRSSHLWWCSPIQVIIIIIVATKVYWSIENLFPLIDKFNIHSPHVHCPGELWGYFLLKLPALIFDCMFPKLE